VEQLSEATTLLKEYKEFQIQQCSELTPIELAPPPIVEVNQIFPSAHCWKSDAIESLKTSYEVKLKDMEEVVIEARLRLVRLGC
jgi:hypothetical protein